jgi:hypothetical protein
MPQPVLVPHAWLVLALGIGILGFTKLGYAKPVGPSSAQFDPGKLRDAHRSHVNRS